MIHTPHFPCKPLRLIVIIVLSLLTILGSPVQSGGAQTSNWSTPVRISQEGSFGYSPYIVADPYGTLHVAWSENVSDPIMEDLNLDTIYYASHTSKGWSEPLDIFVAPTNGQARINRLRIDETDQLHLLYITRPGIVYASVPIDQATQVKAWKVQRFAENAYTADLGVSSDGTMHIVYVLERKGVYYVHSIDGGVTWTTPTTVYEMPDDTFSSGSVRIEVGVEGTLHVAWTVSSSALRWTPAWISYARSADGGRTWNSTLTVEERDNLPNIGFDGHGYVHLVWDNLATTIVGRGHAWSINDGRTWTKPERIFPGLRGSTLWPVMALDSGNNFYLVTGADSTVASGTRLFFSTWKWNQWEEPIIISQDIEGCESPSIAVSEGNLLNVVWFSYNPEQYGIWYTSLRTSSPSIDTQKEPPSKIVPEQPVLTATPSEKPKMTETVMATQTWQGGRVEPVNMRNGSTPLLISGGLVLLLIVIIIIIRSYNSRR